MVNQTTEDKKTEANQGEDSLVAAFSTYLKERLDSPFLFCFLIAWAILNRDFCFYFFISEETNKAQVLANWDFRADIYPYTLVKYGNSFILPAFFGTLTAVFFPPISYMVTGLKYHASAALKHWATKGKSKFDLQTEISDSETTLNELKSKLIDIEGKIQNSNEELQSLEKSINKGKMIKSNFSYFKLFNYFKDAIEISNNYRKNESQFLLRDSSSVKPNCVVYIKFSTSQTGISHFKGTVGEFFLHQTLDFAEEDMRVKIFEVFIEATVGQPINFDQYLPGESGSFEVLSAEEFYKDDEDS